MLAKLDIELFDPTGTELLKDIPNTATPTELDSGTKYAVPPNVGYMYPMTSRAEPEDTSTDHVPDAR